MPKMKTSLDGGYTFGAMSGDILTPGAMADVTMQTGSVTSMLSPFLIVQETWTGGTPLTTTLHTWSISAMLTGLVGQLPG